jgi:hypothetical protein
LAQWIRDPNLLVNLPATKALGNLDQKYGESTFSPGVYMVVPNDRIVKHDNGHWNRPLGNLLTYFTELFLMKILFLVDFLIKISQNSENYFAEFAMIYPVNVIKTSCYIILIIFQVWILY